MLDRLFRVRGSTAAKACALPLVWLLTLLASLSACRAPVALAEVHPNPLPDFLESLPEDAQAIELVVDADTTLRGVWLPPDPGGAVVVHFQESGGSMTRGRSGRALVLRQLKDLGLGSLMFDWGGVGLSSGERRNANLPRDATAVWREAMRRVDGDERRLVLRATSLGTIAAAGLVQAGARPGGMIWIAPVRAETAAKNFARWRYGSFFGGLFTLGMPALLAVDVEAAVQTAPCPLLVLFPAEPDVFLGESERTNLVQTAAPDTRFGEIPGGHLEAALRARVLVAQELAFLEPFVRPPADVDARAESMLANAPGALGLRVEVADDGQARLRRAFALLRGQPPERAVAAALSSRRAWSGVQLLWSLVDGHGQLEPAYGELEPTELVDALSLADPAGELPLGPILELRNALRAVGDVGGVTVHYLSTSIPAMAWAGGAGIAGGSWTTSGEVQWLGLQSLEFDHAAIWRALLESGLEPGDARRQLARILLIGYGHAQRVRTSEDGAVVLEVHDADGWVPLDIEQTPERFVSPSAEISTYIHIRK